MQVRTTSLTELRGHEVDARLSDKQLELWSEIRKRMPGVRVGLQVGSDAPHLFYQDEHYARGYFGYSLRSSRAGYSTFFVHGPFIRNRRGGDNTEFRRIRSKSAATLARKAKEELRAWTVRDRAVEQSVYRNKVLTEHTPEEKVRQNRVTDAKRLLFGFGYISPTTSFLRALRSVTLPDQSIQHAVNLLIEDEELEAQRGPRPDPVYVAVYEKRGLPVFDYYQYANNTIVHDAEPQDMMSSALYERLSVLNVLEENVLVEDAGMKVSDFEFILLPPEEESV